MHIKTNYITTLGLSIACFLFSSGLNATNVSAYTTSITTSSSIELDITPNGDGTSIHSESINVQSDCRAGYNLTIATPEGSSLYKYSNNTQADTASFTAVDGTSALSSSNNTNKWGYTLTSNPTSSTVFSPLSSTAAVLKTPSQTASPSADINDTFNINYGAKVDNTVDAGTYQMANNGAIVYYLTMDTTCTQYTVAFNPNGGTGTMDNQGIEAGEPTNLSANTFTAPAFGSSYEDANGDTIAGTANTYWRFNGWNTAIDGTGTPYDNEEEVEDLAGIGSTITLYAQWEALSAMIVNFNTNGMAFEDETTTNTLGYYHDSVNKYVSYPSYSHTANINDDGTQIDSTTYANNLATKEVVTIPNADSLHVTIKYGTENNWDMLYVFQGTYTGSVTRNMNAGQLAKYMGGNNTTTTVEIDIPGDTATFAFYSDSSGQYWGYHATVVGYYDEEPASYASTIPVYHRALVYGEYQEPAPDNDHVFTGWSENSSATTPDYTSADDILNNLPGGNGDTKTLYATWNPVYHITYVNNCGTYISGNSSCTQSVSNDTKTQNINLNASGNGSGTLGAYNYNSWTISGWKIKGWSTVADNSSGINTEYPVSSTYSVTGQGVGAGITLYAHWVKVYSIQYYDNGADNPNGMGRTDAVTGNKSVKQINVGEGDSVILLPSNFKRAGYGFVGWSTDQNAWTHFTDNDSTNDPTIYGPMETLSAPANPNNSTNTFNLYAVWVPAETSNGNPVYLQDFGDTECSSLTSASFNSVSGEITAGSVIALTDKRDNQAYAVAKLADDKCWMIENLRLDNQYTMGQNQNDNSVTNQSLAQGYGGTTGLYGNFVGLAASESSNFTNSSVANTVYKASANPPVDTYDPINNTLEDIGSSNYPGYHIPRYNNSNTKNLVDNTTYSQNYANALSPSNSSPNYIASNIYSYGNYYNWAAAMANTNRLGYDGAPLSSNSSETVDTSICPSGWHLPSAASSGNDKELNILSISNGGTGGYQSSLSNGNGATISNRFRSFPNNFLFSGYCSGTCTKDGTYSYYWTRSAMQSNYHGSGWMLLGKTAIDPRSGNTYNMVRGASVRCISTKLYTVTVNMDQRVQSVTISNPKYGTQTITNDGDTITLTESALYSISATIRHGYQFNSWSVTAGGEIGSTTSSETVFSVNANTSLSITGKGIPYTIQYDGNNADNPNGMGTTDATTGEKSVKQINVVEGINVTLLPSNFKRAGYGFAGWSTDSDAWAHFTDNDNSNNPVIYGPTETITAPFYPGSDKITMYAVWVPAKKDGNNNPVYLQDFDGSSCSNLTSVNFNSATGTITTNKNSIVALTDKRDNEVYAIAKLADDNCWMIENLRLESTGTLGNSINDSSVTNQSLSQGYGGTPGTYGSFVGLANSESNNFNDSIISNTIYKSSTNPPVDTYDPINSVLEDIGTTNNPNNRFPRYNNINTNSLVDSITYTQNYTNANNPSDSGTNYRTSSNLYSYGNYYTWAAAMANTNYMNSSSISEAAGTSICPTGWHLPSSSGVNQENGTLSQHYGGTGDRQSDTEDGNIMSNRIRHFPNNYIYSGYYYGTNASGRGTYGDYWSRSASDASNSYRFFVSSTSFYPSGSTYSKYYGFSIRCLVSSSQ